MIILKSQRRTLDRSLPADVATIGDWVFPTTIVPCTFCKMCNVAVRNDGKLMLRRQDREQLKGEEQDCRHGSEEENLTSWSCPPMVGVTD